MTDAPVVLGSAAVTAAARSEAARSGYRLVALDDVAVDPWSLRGARIVATGPLRTREDVRRAVHVVSRGGGLIAELELDPPAAALLLDDLRRLRRDVSLPDPADEITGTERALVRLLAGGATVTAAAAALFISRRTADRHLARLRVIAGVDSNKQAVVWFASREAPP